MICEFIAEHRAWFGVTSISRVLSAHGAKIAPRTFYAWQARPPSKRALWDMTITEILAGHYEPNQPKRRVLADRFGVHQAGMLQDAKLSGLGGCAVTVRASAPTPRVEVISPVSIDSALIEDILRTACLSDPEISARVADIGPGTIAEALLAEVVGRATLLVGPADDWAIQCDLGFSGERLGYVLTLGDHRARVETGWDSGAAATVRQDLVDLLRELFGPRGPHGVTRELFKKDPSVGPRTAPDAAVVAAITQLVCAVSQGPKSLADLAVLFGTDKWGGHWYTPHYQRYFESYRELAVKVLEIGVGGYDAPDLGGESLRMWKHYFRRGLIYGLDVFDKPDLAEDRLYVLQGDQGDKQFLDSMARQVGPFDIIIDDGSHFSHHVIASFNALFPHVRPGGLYVIEDLQTSYWPGFGGNTDPSAQGTSMAMIKSLLDGLNHQEQMRESGHKPSTAELTVTGVHVHHNLAFIEKGLNTEQGPPASVARTGEQPSRMYADE